MSRTTTQAPAAPRDDDGLTLAQRYARMAHDGFEPRPVDRVLRALDVVLAGSLLVATAPVMALVALVLRVTSGSPVLYRGQRVGLAGTTFTMYKFRTLRPDAETRLGPFAGHELDRLTEAEMTRVGRALRATHLDELPQLINILRGDMAVVGPRPIRPAFFESLCGELPLYWQRLVVRPGLTGFAQLRIVRGMSWAEKLGHDLEYIADRSVALYLHVVVLTGRRVIARLIGASQAPEPGGP